MKYYNIVKNWQKVKKHLNDEKLNKILIKDFNKFTYGRWKMKFKKGMFPRDFESCDWDWDIKGRKPEYYKYVKHSACHWLVNFNLKLATLVQPEKEWRILTSDKHSTVWDGKDTLFDINFFALRIDPNHAFELANESQMSVSEFIPVEYVEYYKNETVKN